MWEAVDRMADSIVTPYYADDLVTIYHGDCRGVMPALSWDVLATDPPYGISYSSSYARWSGVYDGGSYADADGRIEHDEDLSLRDYVLTQNGDRPALVCGSRKTPEPPGCRAVLVWDKGDAAGMGDLSIPWKPNWELVFVLGEGFAGKRTSGVLRATNISRLSMGRAHPTEKPVTLWEQLIDKAPPGTVLDPFMGSGTTLVAAKNLGRKAIGIELEERYCEIAAQRCSQEVLAL